MPKETTGTVVAEKPAEGSKTAKSYTNWDALAKSGLTPILINCQAYRPVHMADFSCHSALPTFNVTNLRKHIASDHGACFEIFFKRTDGKESPLWKELSESGLEAGDIRCGCCSKPVRLHPTSLLQHCKPHAGDTKQRYTQIRDTKQGTVGMFRLTLQTTPPESQLQDTDEFPDN